MTKPSPLLEPTTLWRSQFVLGRSLPDLEHLALQRRSVGDMDLWASPALKIAEAGPVTVLGHAAPLTGGTIADLFAHITVGSTQKDVAEAALDLAGRFVVVAALASGVIVFVDGIGSRRMFLSADATIASTSEVLLEKIGAEKRPLSPAELDIVNHPGLFKREFATYGIFSPLSGFRRLLPNRVANLSAGSVAVCSPATERREQSVPEMARTLRRNAAALATLGPLEFGLTSGSDSRLLAAAFAAEGVDVLSFTYVDGGENKEVDAGTAERIAKAAGFRYQRVTEPTADPAITEVLTQSQPILRPHPHVLTQLTLLSRRSDNRFTVGGLGGEVSRSKFALMPSGFGREYTRRTALGGSPHAHDLVAFDEWWDDRFGTPEGETHISDWGVHYWEQRVAVWGTQYMAEKDLFMDEASGYASGRVQQEMTSFPQFKRTQPAGTLFADLVEELSPEIARLGPPNQSSLPVRAAMLTGLPSIIRTLRRSWGQAA